MILIVIYGAHFDLIYDACVVSNRDGNYNYYKCEQYINNKRLLEEENNESECYFKELISNRVENGIINYINNIINSNDWNLNGIADEDEKLLVDVGITNRNNTNNILIGDVINNRMDIYGANITDSNKWIISSIITLLISLLIYLFGFRFGYILYHFNIH